MGILTDNERIELTCVTEVNVFHAFEKKYLSQTGIPQYENHILYCPGN